eukprot:gnl/MRDRNA2_/MRDRNA2_145726_c0_seq1.p1 gnl/MRDRNA2_/MRDRNA2_145726_c0~~gnl/MRDRNA2_/MRDRNA2_145726_c0_seq1.p1  ORF type:complete len:344 (-),score=48.69 gnl/MRDRNA2_/MRDRNA2_145726_c0_seq1:299-1330(-)
MGGLMARDGFRESIKIPSVLLCKIDGEVLISAILKHKGEPPMIEISWDLHQRRFAKMDLWTSPGAYSGVRFLAEFAPHARILKQDLNFQPHYHATSLNLKVDDNNLCMDDRMDLCTEDPDESGPSTGEDVLYESVRQYCIWERTKYPYYTRVSVQQYSEFFWNYVERLALRCSIGHLSQKCSEQVMAEVGIDLALIQDCVEKQKYNIMEHERDNRAWNVVALRIDDWRYSGPMSADIISRALCAGFVKAPKSCKTLLSMIESKQHMENKQDTAGSSFVRIMDHPVSIGEFVSALVAVILLLCCFAAAARKLIVKNTREAMRYDIMNEVTEQIRASRTGTATSI